MSGFDAVLKEAVESLQKLATHVRAGYADFGPASLCTVLGLGDFLAAHPEARARWLRPLPLTSRTALLRGLGCPEGVIREVERVWQVWRVG